MVHPLDEDMWKALDNADPQYAKDARNVHIGQPTNGFTSFAQITASY